MTDHVEQTIGMIRDEITQLENSLVEKKRLVNQLCAYAKLPPVFGEADLLPASSLATVRPDEYYGQPLAKAMRMVLDRRQAANIGPASVNEIYDALVGGGFKFETKNDDYAKRNLYTALTKNTSTFHKLPNSLYGLLEWYPNAKETKAKSTKGKAGPDANGSEDEAETEAEVTNGGGGFFSDEELAAMGDDPRSKPR